MNAATLPRALASLGVASMIAVLGTARPARAQISPGPLARAHRTLEGATQCAACHGLRREPMNRLCLDCHKEVSWLVGQRRGLHAQATVRNRTCASCHPDHAGAAFSLIEWEEGSAERFDHERAGWTLEGGHKTERCESCHATKYRASTAATLSPRKEGAGWMGLETRCLSCHRGDDVHKNSLGTTCNDCHTANAWDDDAPKFDHATSDYPLTGKHADVACDECHLAPRLRITPGADGKRVALFKPVSYKECSDCHDDVHRGRLGARCASCHDTKDFAAVDRRDFDHGRTKYPLKGRHATVGCTQCHGPKMAKPTPAFATCVSCHADPHRGDATLQGAATDCATCHRVEAFAPSTFTATRHAQTRYPLDGKHAQVRCAACHPATASSGAPRGKVARIRVPFAECATCHADAHAGQLAHRDDKGRCDACHTASGFKPSTFVAAQHATLRVSLDGRHGTVACTACHAPQRPGLPPLDSTYPVGKAKIALHLGETECTACHVDPHAGRYAMKGARPEQAGCLACHAQGRFRPSIIDAPRHARLGFALEGAHRATPCAACHAVLRASAATRTLVRDARGVVPMPFAEPTTRTCASCHESPHGAQFSRRADAGSCEGCHDAVTFASAPAFDHERESTFSLKGAHVKVPCGQCHRPLPDGPTMRVVYKPLDGRCESCHGVSAGRGRS